MLFKGIKRGVRKILLQSMFVGVALGIVVTSVFVYFLNEKNITLHCLKGGTVESAQDVMIWKCDSPQFTISCNVKTFNNIQGVKKCTSFDGIRYKLLGNFSS